MKTHFAGLRGLTATAVFTVLASGISAVGAAADPPTVIVRYGDLNVLTAEGATALYLRIRSAARHVCSSFDRPLDLNAQALKKDCISQVIAKAVTEVNSPALLLVYKANNGMPLPMTLLSQEPLAARPSGNAASRPPSLTSE
jgi:UrcA family protein